MDLHETRASSDLELLQIEMDLLWGTDAGPQLVLACARDGVHARIGNQVASDVARAVAAEIGGAASGTEPDTPPPQVERWRMLVENALGVPVRLAPASGPSYLIERDVRV